MMKLWTGLSSRLRTLFQRAEVECEMEEELHAHIARRAEDHERSGLSHAEAERRARIEFGGYQKFKEECREATGTHFLETLLQDIRFGLRMFRKSPGFTAVAVLTLALGIGANTAIFSVVEATLLRPLPFKNSDRLVLLWEKSQQLPVMMAAYPDYLDWRQQNKIFEDMAVYNRHRSVNLTGVDQPERLPVAVVSASFFNVLGIEPALGRGFLPEEDQRANGRVVILRHGFWQRQFGGHAQVLGQTLRLNNQSYTVVGVMPPGFSFPPNVDLWMPMGTFIDDSVVGRENHPGLIGIARVNRDATLEQARAEMDTIARRLEQQYPKTNAGVGVTVTALQEAAEGGVRPTLWILIGAVGFVLLIACANAANLLLARATARQKEIAVRAALGAGRGRLVRQLLTESVLLSLLSVGLGLLLAWWGTEAVRTIGLGLIPRASGIQIDYLVFAYTLVLTLVTGILFGLAPALQSSRAGLLETLKEGGRNATAGLRGQQLRRLLVITEVALSLVLLVGAGLLIQSFIGLLSVSPGFDPKNVLTLNVSLPAAKYPEGQQVKTFYQQVIERIHSIPGVQSAAAISPLPFSNEGWQAGISIEGKPEPSPGQNPLVDAAGITPDYFQAMQIPLLRGRFFNEQDVASAPRVVVVSEAFAKRFWQKQNTLGKRIKFGGYQSKDMWMTVVGVVGDVKRGSLDTPPRAEFYLPHMQQDQPSRSMAIVVRTSTDALSVVSAVRSAVLGVDEDQPVYGIQLMEQLVEASVAQRRFTMVLLGIFAAAALVLAAIGIYSVITYLVTQRTHEIGIRLALGAQSHDVLKLVLRQGVRLTLIGVSFGLAGALLLTRFMASLLYGVTPTDPVTFASVSSLLVAVALLACYLPARRAMRVDPMVALRHE